MTDILITDNFLLDTPAAVRLYHEFAREMPIIDYHSHLPPQHIAEDHQFRNLTEIWLAEDHYRWRAMRANGIDERYCTGDASDWEKFQKWAETVPKTLRNPLYHWTHLELKRPLGISDRLLNPDTAEGIWNECNAKLAQKEFSCRGILRQMRVEVVCTTDDPADNLEHHIAIAADPSFPVKVLPTFRPDKGLAVESPAAFNGYLNRLGEAAGIEIFNLSSFLAAMRQRHDFFHERGCRLSDHGLEGVPAEDAKEAVIKHIFHRIRSGKKLDRGQIAKFRSAMLHEWATWDHEKGWVQQFHLGPIRNLNSRQFAAFGPDAGCDSMSDRHIAHSLARFLDRLDAAGKLPKSIFYNLNPAHSEVLAAMLGNFQDGSTPGKLQLGSGWWFLDQRDGMTRQIETLSAIGLLSRFVGMLTDSRSFLSYTRHEYFRRLLCNILGNDIEHGLVPRDFDMVGAMVRDICYNNAAAYFGF